MITGTSLFEVSSLQTVMPSTPGSMTSRITRSKGPELEKTSIALSPSATASTSIPSSASAYPTMSRMASSSSTMSTLGIRFRLWQLYPHRGPDAHLGANRHLAAHSLHEILADRQTKTKAARGTSTRVEALEEVGEVLPGDASGPILDGHGCSGDAHSHRLVDIRMLDGVGYGDEECLREQRGIGEDPCRWA